jgi:hypothetical protein
MDTEEDVTVYSWGYYIHYSQGDDEFAEFLQSQDKEKAERNRKILRWTDCEGNYHSVNLPEREWRSVVHKDFPDPPLPEKVEPQATETGEQQAAEQQVAEEPASNEPADTEPTAQDAEELERQRAAERAKMREKCMMAAETRRWDIRGWSCKKRRAEDGREVCIVPSLSELAEKALQKAYELAGEDIQLHPYFLKMQRFPTPVDHNGELCRIFRARPAVE